MRIGYVTKKSFRACGTNMTTTAVCGVCKDEFHGDVVDVLKWKLLRMHILTSEPYTRRKFQQ
jgi:hypothetical protein